MTETRATLSCSASSSKRAINYGISPCYSSFPPNKTNTKAPHFANTPFFTSRMFSFSQTLLETRRDLTRQVERLQDALDNANEVPKTRLDHPPSWPSIFCPPKAVVAELDPQQSTLYRRGSFRSSRRLSAVFFLTFNKRRCLMLLPFELVDSLGSTNLDHQTVRFSPVHESSKTFR